MTRWAQAPSVVCEDAHWLASYQFLGFSIEAGVVFLVFIFSVELGSRTDKV